MFNCAQLCLICDIRDRVRDEVRDIYMICQSLWFLEYIIRDV